MTQKPGVAKRWAARLAIRRKLLAAAEAKRRKRIDQVAYAQRVIARARKPLAPTRMFDHVDVSQIPGDAKAVAGYVGGKWPTYSNGSLAKRFPHARKLGVAVHAGLDAECLDVEPGDARPEQAPAWVKRQHARGVRRPVVYCSVSTMPQVLELLSANGIGRNEVRLWSAHYTHKPHVCGPQCGFGLRTTVDATQFTDRSHGRSLDESACTARFWT